MFAQVEQPVVSGPVYGLTSQTLCKAVLNLGQRGEGVGEELHDVGGPESGEALREVAAHRTRGIAEAFAESAIAFNFPDRANCAHFAPQVVRKPPTLEFPKVSWSHT